MNYPNEEKLYATGIERSFIACIMKFPELISSAAIHIPPVFIYSPNFNIIYKVLLDMKKQYDLNREKYIFTQELISKWIDSIPENDKKILERTISRYSQLSMIQNAAGVDPESFSKYISIIKETNSMILAYRMTIDLQNKIMNPRNSVNAKEVIDDFCTMMSSLKVEDENSAITRMGDCLIDLKRDIQLNRANKGRIGIWISQFPRLMKTLNGIRRTQFIILFARPKTGKSSLLLNIALQVMSQNIPVLYIDTEMTQKEQASRAISSLSGVDEWDITGGSYLDSEEKKNLVDGFEKKLQTAPFYYVAAKGCDVITITNYMKTFVEKNVGYDILDDGTKKTKPCLVIYDWLKVADSDSLKQVKEYQELGFIATALNDARRELDIPLIAGAQANRFGNEKDVGVDSAANAQNFLADSDRLLRFCTCLIWLRRLSFDEMQLMKKFSDENPDKFYNQMIHVVDQRGGPLNLEGIGLNFTGKNLTYEEKDPVNLLREMKQKRKRDEKIKKRDEVSDSSVQTQIPGEQNAIPF